MAGSQGSRPTRLISFIREDVRSIEGFVGTAGAPAYGTWTGVKTSPQGCHPERSRRVRFNPGLHASTPLGMTMVSARRDEDPANIAVSAYLSGVFAGSKTDPRTRDYGNSEKEGLCGAVFSLDLGVFPE